MNDKHYRCIQAIYQDRTTRRSGVRLMDHIDQGLVILDEIGSSLEAKQAYCLHPVVQSDEALAGSRVALELFDVDVYPLMLAMEYRSVANACLLDSHDYAKEGWMVIELSPVEEVNDMLIADKVQNRKDFDLYHAESHANSIELSIYFGCWLARLGLEKDYERLAALIGGGK